MKIGLIGNMNNNNFALMRYFRDLGADAHLLLWSDDGVGSSSHFGPESDTWNIEMWQDSLHRLTFPQSHVSVIGRPGRLRLPPSGRSVRDSLAEYERLVGSGLSPVIVARAGRRLDIFYPYSTGIEYVDELTAVEVMRRGTWRWRLLYKHLRRKQIEEIRRARYSLNAEMGPTEDAFRALGVPTIPLAIPMVYNREAVSENALPEDLRKLRDQLLRFDFKCFSHASHRWVWEGKIEGPQSEQQNKHNDWLIRGFSQYLGRSPVGNSVLVLLDYGPDVVQSKRLIRELGIEDNVVWMPCMPRVWLMHLLEFCDVGVGEFTVWPGCIWGGTGWEVLASGKPLLQAFNFPEGVYEKTFGHSPPPLLDVKSSDDVTRHLLEMAADPEKSGRIGRESADWFNTHNGIGLARKWLDLLQSG